MSDNFTPYGWTAFDTHKDTTLYVTKDGEFGAIVNGEQVLSTSKAGIIAKIQKQSKRKFRKVEGMTVGHYGHVEFVTVTGVTEYGGTLRSGSKQLHGEVYHADKALVQELQRLDRIAEAAKEAVRKEASRVRMAAKRVRAEDVEVPE